MKILMVNKFLYNRGGAETYAFELADYQKKQGHEIAFFGMEDERNLYSNPLDLNVSNVEFRGFSVKQLSYPFRIIYSSQARRKIKRVLEEFRPDYVHLNNINFQLTPSIIYEIKKQGIPIIQTLHDFQLVCPNHMMYREHEDEICERCKGRKYYQCARNKCIHGSAVKSTLGAIEGSLYHRLGVYKHIDAFIAPSQFLADKMAEFGEDSSRIHVLHNFIKPDYKDRIFEKKDYILYFGRLSVQKGIRTMLEAAKDLPDVKFVLAGSGELEDEIKSSGLSNISYVGFTTGEDLIKLIGEAKLSILPTQWYENCPMAVLESFMLGTPVIGARIGGVPELIEDGRDGLLFTPADKADLIEKIRSIYFDDKKLEEMSINARKKLDKFSIDKYQANFETILDSIMNKQRKSKL